MKTFLPMLKVLSQFLSVLVVFGVFKVPVLALSLDPVIQPDRLYEVVTQPLHLEIHLSQRRVYLYHGTIPVKSYPIAIGRTGWETPQGSFKVLQKIENPKWIHPLNGEEVEGGDPDNPLGKRWIGFWTDGKNWVGFHGTPNPETVGTAASHGCVRMYNQDVEELFEQVKIGTPIVVKS